MVGDSKLVWACELMVCVSWWTGDLTQVFSYLSPDDRCFGLNAGVCGGSSHGAGEGWMKPDGFWVQNCATLEEKSGKDAGQVLTWLSLVHIVAFKDGHTSDWISYFLFYKSGIKKEQLSRTPDFIWAKTRSGRSRIFPFLSSHRSRPVFLGMFP